MYFPTNRNKICQDMIKYDIQRIKYVKKFTVCLLEDKKCFVSSEQNYVKKYSQRSQSTWLS